MGGRGEWTRSATRAVAALLSLTPPTDPSREASWRVAVGGKI